MPFPTSEELAREAREALARSNETPEEHFARLVRRGWINSKGEVTRIFGGDAEPEPGSEAARENGGDSSVRPRKGKIIPKESCMPSVPIEEAQSRLPELIGQLQPGEEMTITDHGRPLAHVKKVEAAKRPPRKAGNCKGMLVIVADDDEHLKDFADYMQ